jgi:hypothetical protein
MVRHLHQLGQLKPGETVQGRETLLEYDPHWRLKMAISGFGAICTGVVMLVFAVTKFTSGAWFVVILIPTLVFIFFRIHAHYKHVAHVLSLPNRRAETTARSVQTLILVDDVHAETARLVSFAKSLDHPWQAIHIATKPEKVDKLRVDWDERIGEGELIFIPSPYRLLAEPLRNYVQDLLAQNPDQFVHIILGHLAMDSYLEQLLHQNSAYIFNLILSRMDRVSEIFLSMAEGSLCEPDSQYQRIPEIAFIDTSAL